MNILILASTPMSHILPIEPLIKELVRRENTVYCMSDIKNSALIEKFKAKFIAYPFDFEKANDNINYDSVIKTAKTFWEQEEYEQAFSYFLKKDIEMVSNTTSKNIELLYQVVKNKHIELIIRDAVDKHGHILASQYRIPVIGYITHNLYSEKYFETNTKQKYAVFMKCIEYEDLLSTYLSTLTNRVKKINDAVSNNTEYPLYPMHQFDPRNQVSIIFSTDILQPKNSFAKNRIYPIIYPNLERFEIEKEIPNDLKEFMSCDNRFVYVASGSITPQSFTYYLQVIKLIKKMGYKGIIAVKHFDNEMRKYVQDRGLEKLIYVSSFVPQQYILSKASLFITSGGQNSIIESIFHKVPMIVTPMSSEQRMNGVIIENLGIGYSIYNHRKNKLTLGKMINTLLSNEVYEKLVTYANDIINHKNNFSFLNDFLERRKL